MTDITDHIKTVREALQSHLAWDTGFDALASLDAIEEALEVAIGGGEPKESIEGV